MSVDQCHWPRCRQAPGITLGFADNIRLCDKHWELYCDIELEEDPTIVQVVKHEKACLRLQSKCGSAGAKRRLVQMDRDLDNYRLQTVGTSDGGSRTVAEYREVLAVRADVATVEEPEEEDIDEFGDLGDYL